MRKPLAAVAFFFLAGVASAEPVPAPLQKSLASYQVQTVVLQNGTLNVTTKRPVVTAEVYRNVVSMGACLPLWQSAQGWGTATIDRIEVRNVDGTQGFAFQGGRNECAALGEVPGGPDATNAYIAARTLVCVAGNECRPRRPGEKIAGE